MATAQPDPGSFRDPTSRVFVEPDRVLRALSPSAAADYAALEEAGFYRAALDAGSIVGTRRLPSAPEGAAGDWAMWLEHDRVPVITYPYEWSFSMLRDAALQQLDLTAAALSDGLVTKDASAYNSQFIGARPTFIDVGSFEPWRDGDPWFGYRQFCQMHLFPLMLQAFRSVPYQPWLRGSIDGISPAAMKGMLSRRDLRRRGVFTHVWLHARAEARYAERDVRAEMRRAGYRREVVAALVAGLRKRVSRLRWSESDSTWSSYGDRSHYTDADLELKERFVTQVAAERRRHIVWDVGANDGRFSRLVAPMADHVLAIDSDALVVDTLYRALKAEQGSDGASRHTNILPLLLDLADPSPSQGWRGRERPALWQRARPDLVLNLAVIHHLAITRNVPLGEYVDFLAELGGECVVEMPAREDPMVERLLRAKRDASAFDYDGELFEAAFRQAFDVRRTETLPSGTRTLYHGVPLT